MSLVNKLREYAKHNLNVMLIGSHGIGKTAVTKLIADNLGLRFRYYSSPTLDPWADIVGIPKPVDGEENDLKFYRPKILEQAEFIFFDELNRAHPRVLNAVLEIIQFKSVNGYKLPNLRMVWAAINPPGDDYQVEELDPALVDRFHVYIKMKPEINLEYMDTKMKPEVARMLKGWWEGMLDDEQRRILTPRRVEYLGMMITAGISWRDAMPQGHPFPTDELDRLVRTLYNPEADLDANKKEDILKHTNAFLKLMKEDPRQAIPIANTMGKFSLEELFECRDLLENLPKELIVKVGERKWLERRKLLQDIFASNNVDVKGYPKICEGFGWNKNENQG